MTINFNLPNQEWAKVIKGALIAGVGVALTYISQNLSGADFGEYGPVAVGIISVVVNYLRKAIAPQETVVTQITTTTTTTTAPIPVPAPVVVPVPVPTEPVVEKEIVVFEEK